MNKIDDTNKPVGLPGRNCTLHRVGVDFLIDLRYRVLRSPEEPQKSAYFNNDYQITTRHMALIRDTFLVSCGSFILSDDDDDGRTGYKLRGMATEPDCQKQGYGRLLLQASEEYIMKETGVLFFWCKARISAVAFYQNCGWSIDSNPFEIKGYGMHRYMSKQY